VIVRQRGAGIAGAGVALDFGRPVTRVRWANQAEQVLFLRQVVDTYRGWPEFRKLAAWIVFDWAKCPMRDKRCHALAIARWVQEHIRYINEGEETFMTPVATLTEGYGDCDEFTTLIASLIESIGIDCQVVGLEWDGQYRHSFPRAVVGRMPNGGGPVLLPLDATLDTPVGRPLQDPVLILHQRGKTVATLAL